MALALILFHFFLPFFLLLFRENKRQSRLIVQVAILVLAMHWVDLIWLVVPASSDPASPRISWIELPLSLVAMLGIGGLCTAFFIGHLKGRPLVPLNDPNLNEAIEHAGGLGRDELRPRRRGVSPGRQEPEVDDSGRRISPGRIGGSRRGHEPNTIGVRGIIICTIALFGAGIAIESSSAWS